MDSFVLLCIIVFCLLSFVCNPLDWICWFSVSFLLLVSPRFLLFSLPRLCLLPILCAEVAQLIGLLAGGKRSSLTMTVIVWRGRRRGRLFCSGRISVTTTVSPPLPLLVQSPQCPAHLTLTENLRSRWVSKHVWIKVPNDSNVMFL